MTTTGRTYTIARKMDDRRPLHINAAHYRPLVAATALHLFEINRQGWVDAFEAHADAEKADRAAGYRSHYCVHGTNNWTDYDNICGPCEDGLTSLEAYLPILRQDALRNAKLFWADLDKLTAANEIMIELKIEWDFTAAFDQLSKRYRITD